MDTSPPPLADMPQLAARLTPYGVLIDEALSLELFTSLLTMLGEEMEMSLGAAEAHGAVLALGPSAERWEQAIRRAVRASCECPLERWQHGPDRGISSKALFEALSRDTPLDARKPPYDASDWRRCVLMLQLCPSLRERFVARREELATAPPWASWIARYEETLAALDLSDAALYGDLCSR